MMTNVEDFIRRHVHKILTEAQPAESQAQPSTAPASEPAPTQGGSATIRRGKIGKGRISRDQIEAGALALKDPQKLLKKLGISGTPAGTGPEKVLNLIRTALQEKTVMSQAYAGARVLKDNDGRSYIRIIPGDGLSERTAAIYIFHILTAAKNLIGDIGTGVVVGTNDANEAVIEFEKKRGT